MSYARYNGLSGGGGGGGSVNSVTASGPLASSGGANPNISLTGIVPILNGGTGQTTANAALNALLPNQATHAGEFLTTDGVNTSWVANGGGSVTSVGLALPSIFSISGSPVTTSGTLTGSFNTQTANTIFSGPATGIPATPTFRSLVAADLPLIDLTSGVTGVLPPANGGTGVNNSFNLTISATSDISGTNTGDVTLGTANGLSLLGQALSLGLSSTSTTGALSDTDWDTFNNKQAAGNYITDLTGDVTATGPGSVAATLATVNGNVGTFGSSTSIPTFTVNAKGLITAASGNAVIAPAGTLSGTTLNATVVSSSLTSVGTITSGTWNGTTIAIANGGTGQTTQTAAFDALAPTTTKGDLIVHNGTDNIRVAVGTDTFVLTADSGAASGVSWAAAGGGGGLPAESYVLLDTGNGFGSTYTSCRRFTNNTTVGSDITYTDSATLGAVLTVNTAGRYIVSYSDGCTVAAQFGVGYNISNATLGTSQPTSLPTANLMAMTYCFANGITNCTTAAIYMNVNDTISAITDANPNLGGIGIRLYMSRVS